MSMGRLNTFPLGPCMTYILTWMVHFYGINVGKYTIPWSYGLQVTCSTAPKKIKICWMGIFGWNHASVPKKIALIPITPAQRNRGAILKYLHPGGGGERGGEFSWHIFPGLKHQYQRWVHKKRKGHRERLWSWERCLLFMLSSAGSPVLVCSGHLGIGAELYRRHIDRCSNPKISFLENAGALGDDFSAGVGGVLTSLDFS